MTNPAPLPMKNRRRKLLIEPRIQLTFALLLVAVASAAILVQTIALASVLNRVAANLPSDGLELTQRIPDILASTSLLTYVLLAPLTLVLGVRSLHKVVGPLYRFRLFLKSVAAGERPERCRIRKGDQLQDFCELLNEVTQPLREPRGDADDERPAPVERAA